MSDWFYKFPKLPQVPDHIIQLAYESIRDDNHDLTKELIHTRDSEWFIQNGVKKNSTCFIQYHLDPDVETWILENIIDRDYGAVKFTRSTIDPNGGEKHKLAHTDLRRDYVLIYLTENGGPDHRTVFYREHGKPLIRERNIQISDYSLLTEVASVKIPLHRWILLQSQVLHAVDNIPNHRIGFQIGVNDITAIKSPVAEWTDA